MTEQGVTYVEKACAYVTRNGSELLVFEGPEHDGLQIPKGTIEPSEGPREALCREVIEESGLATTFEGIQHLVTDVWNRRPFPPKRYVRNFFHVPVLGSEGRVDPHCHRSGRGAQESLRVLLGRPPDGRRVRAGPRRLPPRDRRRRRRGHDGGVTAD